jgi:hypothetical protein
MSERWKYQVRSSLIFILLMPLFTTLMDWMDTSFAEAFFSFKFLVRVLVFALVGIFGIGYFNWKEKLKLERNAK